MGDANPILLIHDVGAGGLSNALPEAIAHSQRGGRIDLRKIPSAESELSPMEIWCNEAQERYVLALVPGSVALFAALCERERCPYAVVGEITGDGRLLVTDPLLSATPVDMPIEVLLGKAPRMTRDVRTVQQDGSGTLDRRSDDRRVPRSIAVSADHCRQVVPDHHRRPQRRRHDQPRPDGRPLAGARLPTSQ